MGLKKYHPMTVKHLTVRGDQKYPSTLTKLSPYEHSIHTREIFQEIGNDHMTNTNNHLSGWEGKTIWHQPFLTTMINSLFQRVGHQWIYKPDLYHVGSFLSTSLLLYYFVLVYSCCTYLYVRSEDLVKCPSLISTDCLVPFYHYLDIELMRLTPASTDLLLIPPNQ